MFTPTPGTDTAAPRHVWNSRLGCRFDPNGPQAHRMRFAGFHMPAESAPPTASLPARVDMRQGFPPVTNQTYNCCVAESLTAAYAYAAIAQLGRTKHLESSRLFLYYQARLADGMENQDQGAYIGSGAQALLSGGISEERYHPYSLGPSVKPTKTAYSDALDHKALTIKMVKQDVNEIRGYLAQGYPVTIGFTVYPSIQLPSVEKTGAVPLPSAVERRAPPLGGHAVVLVGYDDTTQRFIFRNSWGTGWGDQGHGSLPYQYLADSQLSQDFWVLFKVDDDFIKDAPAPAPAPSPAPAPPLPQPAPAPSPAATGECCTTCSPQYCCCARTRLAARK